MKVLLSGILVLTAICVSSVSWAQRPVLEGAAGVGSGASYGSGSAETIVKMSPIFVDVDIIYFNDEMPKLEYVIGFQAELQGRVSAGIIPQLRITGGAKRWMPYGLIGAAFIVAPFRLFGPEAGGGLLFRIKPAFGVYAEAVFDFFILGNDLPEDSIVVQTDLSLGVRVTF